MALLDPRTQTVVIRIVYDGAPMAGKSTSIRALAAEFGSEVITPQEIAGRTLYFDWLDYVGGVFEGRQIRCQIVTVPGQVTLASRRKHLLEMADAVVFVGDSTPEGLAKDETYLKALREMIEGIKEPPVGVVFQANKRDHPDAVPVAQMREMLDKLEMRLGVVESVATEGSGIRAAFVFAVGLALARVEDLMRLERLPIMAPSIDTAEDLLNDLRWGEDGTLDLAAASAMAHMRVSNVLSEIRGTEPKARKVTVGNVTPAPPDDRVGSGLVWPPVDSRLILHELSQARIELELSPRGDWAALVNDRWRIFSPASNVYEDLEAGRHVLVQIARIHAASWNEKSLERCVALAEDGRGRYRLWQIIKAPRLDRAHPTAPS
jgi:signal recognition particle receptor subunit beta